MKQYARFAILCAFVFCQVIACSADGRIYKLKVESDTEAGFGALLPAADATPMSHYTAAYSGRLRFEFTSTPHEAIVTFEPDALRLSIGDSTLADKARSMAIELKMPILVMLADGGRITSCRFSAGVSTDTQRFARYLLALTQFTAPPSLPRRGLTWTRSEADPIGAYRAKYSVVSAQAGSGCIVKKVILAYAASEQMVGQAVPEGSTQFVLDGKGQLLALQGMLGQTTKIDGKRTSRGSSRLTLEFVAPFKNGSENVVAQLRGQPKVGLYVPPNAAAGEADIERSALGKTTESELLAKLDQLGRGEVQESNEFYLKLQALAYMQPASCSALGDRLLAAPANGAVFEIVTRALVSAGTEPAQAALSRVVKSRTTDGPAEGRLIPALVALKKPSTSILDSIYYVSQSAANTDLGNMSTMVFGAFGRQLALQSSPKAKLVVTRLVVRLKAARSPDEKRIRLLALGNTGSEEAFVGARPYLKSPDASLRAAAVTALRWTPDSKAPTLICSMLERDPVADVRSSAAGALAFIPASSLTVTALRHALRSDRDAGVRGAALGPLWQARDRFKDVIGDVRYAAEKDPSEEIRKLAKSILSQGG